MMDSVIKLTFRLVVFALTLTWRVSLFVLKKMPLLWRLAKWLYRIFKPRKERPTHGDAHWATDKELENAGRLQPFGFLACFTRSGKRVFTDAESSLMMIAQKGMGKTLTIISILLALKHRTPQPVKVQTPKGTVTAHRVKLPDIILSDPKLGVYKATKGELERLGYKVIILDIANPGQVRMDPFSIFREGDEVDLVRQLENIVKLISPDSKFGKHDHFDNYPRIIIAGIIKFFLKHRPNSATLYHCIEHLLVDKERRDRLFTDMKKRSSDPMIKGAVEAYNSAGKNEMGSFVTSNFEKMKYWLRPSVKAVTEVGKKADGSIDRGWTWEDMFDAEQPTAVFIRAGFGTDEANLVRLYMGCAINSARRRFNETNEPLRKGLWVIIDEAFALGHCDAVVQVNREMREAGLTLLMCWLSMDDLQQTYPEHKQLMSGCDLLVFGGSTEVEWNNRVSNVLGKRTAMSKSESESDRSKGRGAHEQGVFLCNPDEVADLPFEDCIAILRSRMGLMKVLGPKSFRIRSGELIFP